MSGVVLEQAVISGIAGRQVLNTHLEWTIEYTVSLADGRDGRGASPRGETLSIYEGSEAGGRVAPETAVGEIGREIDGASFTQAELDDLLVSRRDRWGTATIYAISTAFYEATRAGAEGRPPRLLFNVLNGGTHAYTNPIRSDSPEYLLVSRSDDLEAAVAGYLRILDKTRSALADLPTTFVGGNRVHDLGDDPNTAAFALMERLLADTGLIDQYGIMVDASAGDWYADGRYEMSVTGSQFEPGALVDEWLRIMDRFDLEILEDPFSETDLDSWRELHERRPAGAHVYGDNLTSVQPDQLEAKAHLVDGVLVKPDQNGTVSGTLRFAERARAAGLSLAASHRSIETDAPFLVHLTTDIGAEYLKVGPFSDFSSVMRTNALLRGARR